MRRAWRKDPGSVADMGPQNRAQRRQLVRSGRGRSRQRAGRRSSTGNPLMRKLRLTTGLRRPLKARVPNSNRDGRWQYEEPK